MFTPEKLKQVLLQNLPGAEIQVVDTVGDNNHFEATIIAPQFEGKTMVAQHQMVNAFFKDALMSGDLHALSLKTYAPSKWQQRQNIK